MKMIVGLGNPDAHFDGTRHNTGFRVLDTLAAAHGLRWSQKDRFKAMVAQGIFDTQKVLLVKPMAYYNLSGDTVQALRQFFKIDIQDILIIHDELDLPFGILRARRGGSDAGNNGIKSICAAVGDNVSRIRFGIANEHSKKQDAADFVLSRFSHEEEQVLTDLTQNAIQLAMAFIKGDFSHTTIG